MPAALLRFESLGWQYYAICRDLFECAFNISEHTNFPVKWRDRCTSRSIVALFRGVPVAFAIVDTKHTLQYICVHRDLHNEKLGSKLLAKLLHNLKDDRSIHLVTADDERLVRWYEKYGFRVTKTYYSEGEFIGADMVRRLRCRSGSGSGS
jgi:ribosomal protein S18 acetylase RimI-like enzyme